MLSARINHLPFCAQIVSSLSLPVSCLRLHLLSPVGGQFCRLLIAPSQRNMRKNNLPIYHTRTSQLSSLCVQHQKSHQQQQQQQRKLTLSEHKRTLLVQSLACDASALSETLKHFARLCVIYDTHSARQAYQFMCALICLTFSAKENK